MLNDDLTAHARQVWRDALGVDVDDTTNFFEAGGHSFMAVRIIAKIDEAQGTRIPLRLLFDNPRFDHFVQAVADERGESEVVKAQ